MTLDLDQQMTALLASASVPRERKRLVYQFGELLREVDAVASRDETPSRTRQKAGMFMSILADKEQLNKDEFLLESFLLNFVGEAMVRAEYLAKPVIEFLRTGLYFYGISNIERFHRRQSMAYMSAHAELLMDFTSRSGLKELVALGQEKLAAGKPFCLVNTYLNAMKKRYWAGLKHNDDACDNSVSLDSATVLNDGAMADEGLLASREIVERDAEPTTFENRVSIMLRVFVENLTETQQRVYLLRHPFSQAGARTALGGFDECLAQFLDDCDSLDGKTASWGEIAATIGTSEKTAKKQYLRALYSLLSGACDEIFQGKLPSGMVRRMLALLRKIVQERDLRIRDNAGLGLGKIVSRWEVALRFVLNNDRVISNSDGDDMFASESMF